MDPERFRRVGELFDRAVELPPGERLAFLDQACGDNPELRRRVDALLAADERNERFLEESPLDLKAMPPDDGGLKWEAGRQIGRYRILEQIGRGGMSSVYLAVRDDDEYRQRVAVKVFGYGADRRDLLRRFRTERQILASLAHPSIARLLDGGTTDDGLPYIVMEHIEGVPIDAYCDRQRLSIDERLELFQTLCAAVQYAHQNLVVHRDLKPTNVLVTADGELKLLDFGIAKLLDAGAFPVTAGMTMTGQRLMTPHYASPEQVRGGSITTASDVYALGVLLYRLLTGRLPYRLTGELPGEVERAVVEQEPERPSTAVGRVESGPAAPDGAEDAAETAGAVSTVTPEAVSRTRRTRPVELRRRLAGDLDNIVLTALRKEPERRYGSAAQLAEDVRRHREGLPVMASPDTFGYRARKFVRRHRFGVGVAAGVAVLLMAVAVVLAVLLARISDERDQVRRERDKASEVATFLQEIFRDADPTAMLGETITAREILERAAERIDRELGDQPLIQAAMSSAIGNVYRNLGLYKRAEPLLTRAQEMRRETLGADHPEVAASLQEVGLLRMDQGDFDAAEPLLRQALALRRRLLGEEHPAVAESLNHLGVLLGMRGNFAESESAFREALALRRRLLGAGHELAGETLAFLARVRKERGDLEAAEELYREALHISHAALGDVHLQIAVQLNSLGAVLHQKGDLADAETLYLEAIAINRKLFGDEHPQLAFGLNNLAVVRAQQGDLAGAEPLLREVVRIQREYLGDEHPDRANSLNSLGRLLKEKGDLTGAEALYREALRILRAAVDPEHPKVALQMHNLGALLRDRGDFEDAEPLLRRAIEIRRTKQGPQHPEVAMSLVALGRLLLARGEPWAAEPVVRQGLEVFGASLPPDHWRAADARSQLGGCLAALERFEEAEPFVVAGYETLAERRGPSHPWTVAALHRVIDLYTAWGRPSDAAAYRSRLPD